MQLDTTYPPSIKRRPTPISLRLFYALIVVSLLTALPLLAVNVTGMALPTVIQVFTTRFLGIFVEAVPFLLMGSITSGLIDAFVRPDDIVRVLPRNRYASTVLGSFMGLVFPVCECGVVPVAKRLFTKGLPVSIGISFLLAAPFMNPIVFASTFIAFGFGEVFVGRFIVTALVASAVGLIFAFSTRGTEPLRPESMLDASCIVPPRPKLRPGLSQAMATASSDFFDMGRFLVIGCMMAAGMQTFVPQETLLAIGSDTLSSVLVMQGLAFILSACSTVDSFLALAFVNTFTTGAIIAFLSFGPMVDVKSALMFLGVFTRRTVFYLILLPFVFNLLAGVAINLMLGYR
jgi:uncharacterized membrane protein YraQ (UPF0718 family)